METQTYRTIQVEQSEAVATIVLNKPPLNILDIAMIEELRDALRAIEADTAIRVIVFRAAGEKAFCAGVSIQDHLPDRIGEMIPKFHEIFRLLARTDRVTVAAVQGHCLGGGLELASMCDFIVAGDNAQFGQPEIKLGQLPPVGVILLPRLIGYRKAAELCLAGDSIGASEAKKVGLINRVVPAGQLARAVEELIAELTSLSGAALQLTKQVLRRVSGFDFEAALRESEDLFLNRLVHTADAKEGISAFLEKRAPKWNHRL
jgi:cyclohexa-1,5-dienecarbonyl-CoA hydratase